MQHGEVWKPTPGSPPTQVQCGCSKFPVKRHKAKDGDVYYFFLDGKKEVIQLPPNWNPIEDAVWQALPGI